MKRALFDTKGQPVAYLAEDGERTICLWDGSPVAYVDDWLNCYGWNGTCLGWIEDGVLYDPTGQAVGFLRPLSPPAAPTGGWKPLKVPKHAKRPPCARPEVRTRGARAALEEVLRAGALEAPDTGPP